MARARHVGPRAEHVGAQFQLGLGTKIPVQSAVEPVCVAAPIVQAPVLGLGLTQPSLGDLSCARVVHVPILTRVVHGQGLSSPTEQPVPTQFEHVFSDLNQHKATATPMGLSVGVSSHLLPECNGCHSRSIQATLRPCFDGLD